MDFRFSPEDELFARTLADYAAKRLAPDYARWRTEPHPRERVRELGELGVLGLRIPEAYGGSGGTFVQHGIATEQLSRGDFNMCYYLQLAAIAPLFLAGGPESHRQQWLPAVAAGNAVLAFGLTEPGVGSDAANLTTRARRDGGDYVITGEKASISFAATAQACVVFARTGGPGARGISMFLVPLDLPGVGRQKYESVGSQMTGRGSLYFDEVRIPAENLLAEEGVGFIGAMQAFDFNRAVIALACIGAAEQSLDEMIAYARTRQTFGRSLAQHEGVAFQIAEHQTYVHAARLVAYETLALADAGEPHTVPAAMCKWMGPKVAAEAIHACLVLHGWPGMGADMPFAQRWADVVGLQIGDGTAEIMKAIIARETFGKEHAAYR